MACDRYGRELFLTASSGVSEYKGGDSLKTIIHRADQALYQAKETGRNWVCLAT